MNSVKSSLLKKTLLEFYSNKKNSEKLISILVKKEVSLRVIEFFCTVYSHNNKVSYKIGKKNFDVYPSYKDLLNSYQKKQFDPFKRSHIGYEKFVVKLYDNEKKLYKIETTSGQLNFFRWVIENRILEYIKTNIEVIKSSMNKGLKRDKNEKTTSSSSIEVKKNKVVVKFN